jgi:hypothetical protein
MLAPVMIPLYFAFTHVREKYIATSREVKREEAMSQSPVYTAFSSTLKGLATVRAYHAQVGLSERSPL